MSEIPEILKEKIKPPFSAIAGYVIDANGTYLLAYCCNELSDTATEIEWRKFIVEAITEKWERNQ